jgi:hypothetical protein
LVLFLIPFLFVNLFCNQSKCILLLFSCISSLLLLFIFYSTKLPITISTTNCHASAGPAVVE